MRRRGSFVQEQGKLSHPLSFRGSGIGLRFGAGNHPGRRSMRAPSFGGKDPGRKIVNKSENVVQTCISKLFRHEEAGNGGGFADAIS